MKTIIKCYVTSVPFVNFCCGLVEIKQVDVQLRACVNKDFVRFFFVLWTKYRVSVMTLDFKLKEHWFHLCPHKLSCNLLPVPFVYACWQTQLPAACLFVCVNVRKSRVRASDSERREKREDWKTSVRMCGAKRERRVRESESTINTNINHNPLSGFSSPLVLLFCSLSPQTLVAKGRRPGEARVAAHTVFVLTFHKI